MSDSEPIILAEGVGRRFGEQWAVRGVDLSIARGEIFGLVGPDGSGKTTLLQMFAAILDPSEGGCHVLGFDTVRQASEVTSRIGYMAQGFTLYERLTVAENLAFAARIRNVPPSQFERRSRRLLSMAGLSPFLDRAEANLSGGMRKKLALCTNIIHEPPLLLLDEPGLGVDPLSRRELWRMLEEFRETGTTIVFATSYMDEAERCDRLAFFDRGNLIASDTPRDLRFRATGAVFEVNSASPSEVESLLARTPGIAGVQRKPATIRFALARSDRRPTGLEDALSRLGKVEPVNPSIEDVFVILSGGEMSDAPGDASKPPEMHVAQPAYKPCVAIRTTGLSRRFANFLAVDGVSIEVWPGEIFGLLGANGAGKTTLIRMLCGLLPPSAGDAVVADIDARAAPQKLRQRIGYMSQRFSLYPDLTVAENLDFFASAYGLARRESDAAIRRAVAMTGLGSIRSRMVGQISGALRQRLGLACGLLHRPAVLFLDEPTSGVDPLARFRFWRLISALAEAGTTIIVTTHYLEEATYCHRLGLMHQGRLIAAGDLQDLRKEVLADAAATAEEVFLAHIERANARTRAAATGAE